MSRYGQLAIAESNIKSITDRIGDLLQVVSLSLGDFFSGTGVVVVEDDYDIPHQVMVDTPVQWFHDSTLKTLKSICTVYSPYHDGFHLLDAELNPIAFCTFLAPKIVGDATFLGALKKNDGSRAYTALFSSAMPGVICTATASRGEQVRLFVNGAEKTWPL
ncbi:hypothetical protein [Endozoicomonas acroporae]|uniref:hypothetical protein n=1 Tax=Endozoicomonas acroporae TaxID=1701104 RepID=UPI003D7A2418